MRSNALWLEEARPQRRFGLKGPRAADLLKQLALNVPPRPNTWLPLRAQDRDDSPNVICRLGNTEFFIEEQGGDAAPVIAALESRVAELDGAYPVLREDFAVVLGGARAPQALAEVCNMDFAALPVTQRPVVMTLMTGVSVLVLPQAVEAAAGNLVNYRIWCDPSFGPYLWETLRTTIGSEQ